LTPRLGPLHAVGRQGAAPNMLPHRPAVDGSTAQAGGRIQHARAVPETVMPGRRRSILGRMRCAALRPCGACGRSSPTDRVIHPVQSKFDGAIGFAAVEVIGKQGNYLLSHAGITPTTDTVETPRSRTPRHTITVGAENSITRPRNETTPPSPKGFQPRNSDRQIFDGDTAGHGPIANPPSGHGKRNGFDVPPSSPAIPG